MAPDHAGSFQVVTRSLIHNSSLLQKSVNYWRGEFYNIGPRRDYCQVNIFHRQTRQLIHQKREIFVQKVLLNLSQMDGNSVGDHLHLHPGVNLIKLFSFVTDDKA